MESLANGFVVQEINITYRESFFPKTGAETGIADIGGSGDVDLDKQHIFLAKSRMRPLSDAMSIVLRARLGFIDGVEGVMGGWFVS